MSGTIAVKGNSVYGAYELKKLYPKYYTAGVTFAVLVHLLLIGVYFLYNGLNSNYNNKIIPFKPIINIRDVNLTPLFDSPVSANNTPGLTLKSKYGIPIPVPKDQAQNNETFPSRPELSHIGTALIEGNGIGQIPGSGNIVIEEPAIKDPGIDEFIPVEKYPELVVDRKPEYPILAVKAGITGWIGSGESGRSH